MTLTSLTVKTIQGDPQSLNAYEGKVLLVVNVASKCGFTGQYAGLQTLHQEYASRGLVVMGFPCDQFGHQEPGDEDSILKFCETQFKVTFPMFAKIEVNGANAEPFYQWLKSSKPGLLGTEAIKWNFTKFLVSRKGQVLKRYAPTDTPESLRQDIEQALAL
jgi:glutathione peroxidase